MNKRDQPRDNSTKKIFGVGVLAFLAVGCCAGVPLLFAGIAALSLGALTLIGIGAIALGAIAFILLVVYLVRARHRPCEQTANIKMNEWKGDEAICLREYVGKRSRDGKNVSAI